MIDSMRKQAVIYCRVSSSKQTKVGDGLVSQETRCRDFARMKGYEVAKVFQDDVSGSLVARPGMTAMLAWLAKRRKIGAVVIIDDVSRLARGLEAHIELRASIAKAGGMLESPSIEFGEDSDAMLVENLLASVSQHQRQKNGEQTRNRMLSRVQNGYWPFQAPVGMKHVRASGRGMLLTRDEPVASVVQEALEGFATSRFETQAEVMRFLQDHPLFPKDSRGIVRHQRVVIMLRSTVYAGYVEAKKWGVSLRPGQHKGLISFETWQRIQDRMNGKSYAPRRRNLNADFPLRGHVACADCNTPLTACWSKGTHNHFPYYLCPKRGCESYGRSIRRATIEGEFEGLLQKVQPSDKLFRVARMMFKDIWDRQLANANTQAKAMGAQMAKVENDIAKLLERIVDASTPSVIAAYEERIGKLEAEKHLIRERIAKAGRPASRFDDALRTALDFLANPWNLWSSGGLEQRRAVLKLVFGGRLVYARNSGFRTTELSLPFKVLDDLAMGENRMARPKRFELLTPRFVVWCSIQLSYGRAPGRFNGQGYRRP
jgi:site-specific DNA recombinase